MPKPACGLRLAVEVHAVAVEAPGEGGVDDEPLRIGHLLEAEAELAIRGVRAPEAFRTAEIRHAGVDAHAGAGGDEQGVGGGDRVGGAPVLVGEGGVIHGATFSGRRAPSGEEDTV
jgi:hypothetical protein